VQGLPSAAQRLVQSHVIDVLLHGDLDELHLRKPDPEIYRSVARQIGTPPGKLLFIDDNAANVSAARGAGWQACHLTGGITVTDLFEL